MTEEEWPVSWEGHRRAQLRDVAKIPIVERLEWLRDALELARSSGALAHSCEARDREALRVWNAERAPDAPGQASA
jgi:hypothetical protein